MIFTWKGLLSVVGALLGENITVLKYYWDLFTHCLIFFCFIQPYLLTSTHSENVFDLMIFEKYGIYHGIIV